MAEPGRDVRGGVRTHTGDSVWVSAEEEDALVSVLGLRTPEPLAAASCSATERVLERLYEELECLGFSRGDVEHALTCTGGRGGLDPALDLLLLRAREIPSRFTSGTSSTRRRAAASASHGQGGGASAIEASSSSSKCELGPEEPLVPPSWTGKSPVSLVHEWCRRKGHGKPEWVEERRARGMPCQTFRYSVRLHLDGGEVKVVPATGVAYRSAQSARYAASVRALWVASQTPGSTADKLYMLMPPYFKSLWQSWAGELKQQQQQIKEATSSHRSVFASSFVASCRGPTSHSPSPEMASPPPRTATPERQTLFQIRQPSKDAREDEALLREARLRTEGQKFREMISKRSSLPVWQHRESFARDVLERATVVLVSGLTGSGKSTQIPQFILDSFVEQGRGSECKVVCTEPRRINATSLAARVAEERCEQVGGRVGYSVRLCSAVSRSTRLLYCTTGVLLRRLRSSPEISHVIVDEVHERDINIDFLLALLKKSLVCSPHVKIVLMSATGDVAKLREFFSRDVPPWVTVASVDVGGGQRLHPVTEIHLEDLLQISRNTPSFRRLVEIEEGGSAYIQESGAQTQVVQYGEVAERVVREIDAEDHDGAALVFLSGMAEIQALVDRLQKMKGLKRSLWLVPLHSTLAPKDQQRAFERPPAGQRKIVLSTNIAETSITIEDVVYVIDFGKAKEFRYRCHKGGVVVRSLDEVWVSKSNAEQRKGRAGRVRPGKCYRLFTSEKHEQMEESQVPEMCRAPVEDLALQILSLGLGPVEEFLGKFAVDPPKEWSVKASMDVLRDVGALELDRQELTPLGRRLAELPVDVRVGRMLACGIALACGGSALTLAAILSSEKGIFLTNSPLRGRPDGVNESREELVAPPFPLSDHVAALRAFNGWKAARRTGGRAGESQYCAVHGLNPQGLREVFELRAQLSQLVEQFSGQDSADSTSEDVDPEEGIDTMRLSLALTCVAMYPRVLRVAPNGNLLAQNGYEARIHPASMVGLQQVRVRGGGSDQASHYLVYQELAKSSNSGLLFARNCSAVSPRTLLLCALLCGNSPLSIDFLQNKVVVDGWIQLACDARSAVLMREVVRRFKANIDNPGSPLGTLLRTLILA